MDTNIGAATSTFSIRLDEGRKARMDSLARATGRSRNYHFLAAVDDYLAEHEWELAEIEAGIREDDADEVVSHADAGAALIAAGLATREGIARERASLLAAMAPPTQDSARNV